MAVIRTLRQEDDLSTKYKCLYKKLVGEICYRGDGNVTMDQRLE